MSILLRNGNILTNEELFALPVDEYGWRVLPDGDEVKIGHGAHFGISVSLGDEVRIGNETSIGGWGDIGDGVSLGDGLSIGNETRIGNRVCIGDHVRIGGLNVVGEGVSIGDGASLGDGVSIGPLTRIGNHARIGNETSIAGRAIIGERAIFHQSPLAVQGTMHLVNQHSLGKVAIGCLIHTVEHWLENYREIGEENGYTPEQIEEYGKILMFVAQNGVPVGVAGAAVQEGER
ncbi:MAG TPA: hypothetical protein VM554_13005 [Acidisarcina sp.]|nr:hypothetical protein [Acidisarcina sp.]